MKLEAIAEALWCAEKDFMVIDPINVDGQLSIDDAYVIQSLNNERRVQEGHVVTGKKIGLTSKAMQDSLGVHQPDFGLLFDSMEVKHQRIAAKTILQPRVEGELAFKLRHDLNDAETIQDVLWATEYVMPAIEIVGSRIRDWRLTIVDTVADNASCGMYLLSERGFDPLSVDMPSLQLSLYRNQERINHGEGSAVLGHPAQAVLWLAKSLARYNVSLNNGDIILAGAFSAAVPAFEGDHFICDFGECGQLSLFFEEG